MSDLPDGNPFPVPPYLPLPPLPFKDRQVNLMADENIFVPVIPVELDIPACCARCGARYRPDQGHRCQEQVNDPITLLPDILVALASWGDWMELSNRDDPQADVILKQAKEATTLILDKIRG